VKKFEAVEFESKTAMQGRSDLPENVMSQANSLQIEFVILLVQR
jgi:hypothetical protein